MVHGIDDYARQYTHIRMNVFMYGKMYGYADYVITSIT